MIDAMANNKGEDNGTKRSRWLLGLEPIVGGAEGLNLSVETFSVAIDHIRGWSTA
jgi:hypothetical protein